MRPLRLLDLFSGAGGVARGYADAGFEVTGVDVDPQPRYPFEFIKADARLVLSQSASWREFVNGFDAIHASPPCQRFSDLAKRNGNGHEWPDLIDPVRRALKEIGKPYVIENVEGAPLIDPIMLCGNMFPELRVYRHRLFESNVDLVAPPHETHRELTFTHDKRKNHYGRPLDLDAMRVQVTGGGNAPLWAKREAMGIDWMIGREINEAIPPAYTEYVGRQLMAALSLSGESATPTDSHGGNNATHPE